MVEAQIFLPRHTERMSESKAGPTMMNNNSPHWEPRIMVAIIANCPLAVRDQLVSRNQKQSQKICKMTAWGVVVYPSKGFFWIPVSTRPQIRQLALGLII